MYGVWCVCGGRGVWVGARLDEFQSGAPASIGTGLDRKPFEVDGQYRRHISQPHAMLRVLLARAFVAHDCEGATHVAVSNVGSTRARMRSSMAARRGSKARRRGMAAGLAHCSCQRGASEGISHSSVGSPGCCFADLTRCAVRSFDGAHGRAHWMRRDSRRSQCRSDCERHCDTPYRHISTHGRFEPCEAVVRFVLERLNNTAARAISTNGVVSKAWTHAHQKRPRGLVRLLLWHGVAAATARALRTSGIALPFVLERLSNTASRLQEPSPRTADLSRVRPW